jgi:hypothetical protein
MDVDPDTGEIYLTGYTSSEDFPIRNAHQSVYAGGTYDAFILHLNPTANQINSSSYLGTEAMDGGEAIFTTGGGVYYVVGRTEESGFPTRHGYDESWNGYSDAFVSKISFDQYGPSISSNPISGAILKEDDVIELTIVDEITNVEVVEYNWDSNPNTTLEEPYQVSQPAGETSHTLRVYCNDTLGNPSHAIFTFSTDNTPPVIILISPENDTIHPSGTTIDLDITDIHLDTVLYGWNGPAITVLESPYELPLTFEYGQQHLTIYCNDSTGNWVEETFVFTTDNKEYMKFSSYFGGAVSTEYGRGIFVDNDGYIYLTGHTGSSDFPIVNPFNSSYFGFHDIFVSKLNPAGDTLVYSTFIGGSGTDYGMDITVDNSGNAYVA